LFVIVLLIIAKNLFFSSFGNPVKEVKLDHYSPFSSSDEEESPHDDAVIMTADVSVYEAATIPAYIDMASIAPDIDTADSDFCDRPAWACVPADIDMTPIAPDIDTADLDLCDGPAEATTPANIDMTPIAPDIDTADLDLCGWPAGDTLDLAVDSGNLIGFLRFKFFAAVVCYIVLMKMLKIYFLAALEIQ
jgi:hypothetical protein